MIDSKLDELIDAIQKYHESLDSNAKQEHRCVIFALLRFLASIHEAK